MDMKKIPVIIDCDPGTDDVTSMMMLLSDPRFDVVGITPVGGNKEIDTCVEISLSMCELLGREDIPVAKGADRPLFGPQQITVPGYCLGNARLPAPNKKTEEMFAWDLIHEKAVEKQGELQILAIGPMMNLGKAFLKYPDLKDLIRRIVIMGGAEGVGNITPAAEFNIWADPIASDIVMKSGVEIVLMPLEICKKAYITCKELDEIRSSGKAGAFLADVIGGSILRAAEHGAPGGAQCDPTAAAYMMDPSLFTMEDVHIAVETKGALTVGKTVFTRRFTENVHKQPNAKEGRDIDRSRFVELIKNTVSYWNERI